MSVLIRILAGVVLGTVAVVATACSSTTSGTGTVSPSSPSSAAVSPLGSPATSSTATSSGASSHHAGTGGHGAHGGSGGSGGHPSSSSATTATTDPTSATSSPPPLPLIDSIDYVVVSSDCSTSGGSTSGTVSVKLTWTSSYATSVWIGGSQVAYAFDPKAASGSNGPLPANGSLSVSFDCVNDYYYYDLGVYNSTGHTIEVEQVRNPS